ncbi:MAG: VWA domain-containing protein, partial [Candidatus Bipolaricaulota bacterium]|nr:VWA domain-containing protein [Candidatus Bipolaricaulota bacterium]
MKAKAYAGWIAGGLLLATLVASMAWMLTAQSATYSGVTFPIGDRAFADRVVEYIAASCVRDAFDDPEEALGPPDAANDGCKGCGGCDTHAVSLGFRLSDIDMRGHLTLEFVDNTLVDGPGNDLFVYITNNKPAQVEISADGFQYVSVGTTVGYPGAIDISPYVTAGAEFRFVRLSDVPADEDHSSCPGASIDAVGAMGPAEAIALATGGGSLEVQAVGQLALALQSGGAEGLLIILDHTSSMEETVEGEVKITVAKEVILDLLNDLGAGSKVGLREFAGCEMTHLLVPIQPLDLAAFGAQVMALTTFGATSIDYTLQQVPGDFAGIAGKKLVLLITDGMETCKGDPVRAARDLLAAGLDLRINVVGFDIARVSKARDQLMQIAQATGGAFLEASNRAELRQALSLSAPFSYSVYDSSGNLVYSGRLGETTGPQLPTGTYRVVINTSPEYVLE